jgi:hypothetical protein
METQRIGLIGLISFLAACGNSGAPPADLTIALTQPFAATDVCAPGAGRCALAWSFGVVPQLDIDPFVTDSYTLTLVTPLESDAVLDDRTSSVSFVLPKQNMRCEHFSGAVKWTQRPAPPSTSAPALVPWALHLDAACSEAGKENLKVIADAKGVRDDRANAAPGGTTASAAAQ